MYKFKFNVTKEDIDAHIKKGITEEEREILENITFVPFKAHLNEDMDIEITAVGVVDLKNSNVENDTKSNANDTNQE